MRTFLLALVLAAAGPLAAQDASSVRPGDVIRLSVWRLAEFSGDFAVAGDGTILHPLLNEVRVVGETRESVHRRLREVLSRYENDPQLVFEYLYRVSVTGEVRLPGLYTLPPETTLSQALAVGGGVSDAGRLEAVRLMRAGEETVLDLRTPSPELAEARIRSGDHLHVVRRATRGRDAIALGASLLAALASIVGAVTVITR
jgi:polysaccharide biosynthesis/export protein